MIDSPHIVAISSATFVCKCVRMHKTLANIFNTLPPRSKLGAAHACVRRGFAAQRLNENLVENAQTAF